MQKVGEVIHYYGKIGVAIVRLSAPVKVGDQLQFSGHGADFTQKITSLQVNYDDVQEAVAGQEVGVKVDQPVHEGVEVTPAATSAE